ncbi:AsmA family protein [Hydrogenophaga sp.]|uniref:AsmA family protein n=1 Tax=Hydrogenophaga sp. TaxID=1904254 RepID=UPI003F706505
MRRFLRPLGILAALFLLLGAAVVIALHQWTGSDGFRQRVEREASAALGVPVTLSRVTVDVWPLPAVALEGLHIQARPALTLDRVEARPVWTALLAGRLQVSTLTLRKAVLPQTTLVLLAARLQDPARKTARPGPAAEADALDLGWLPRTLVLDEVTWINERGRGTTVQADASLDDDGWPASADVKVTGGGLQGTKARLVRDDSGATAWTLKVEVGGGTVQGPLKVSLPDAGNPKARDLVFEGALETRGVEVSALTAPSRPLTGRLEASTTLSARINPRAGAAAITDALRTQTRFTVHGAVLQGLDLARAVVSVGLSRGGLTELDTLAGQVNTRGQTIALSNLEARSGVLSATGEVTVAPSRELSGRLRVDMTRGASGGVVSVPLAVGGTLDEPSVMLSRSALLGAAIGTAIMPGVGTGAGANLGDRIGEGLQDLFGK